MRKLLLTGVALAALGLPAHAGDLALVLGNSDYQRLDDLRGADAPTKAESGLQDAGFSILSEDDADAGEIRARFRDFVTRAAGADRVAVALSGRFVHSGTETWFVPVDARDATLPEMVSEALPLSAVMSVLAAHPGQAVLLLGSEAEKSSGDGLTQPGLGTLDIPQGVTVLRGSPKQVASLMAGHLTKAGAPLARAAQDAGLEANGYLPRSHAFIMAQATAAPAPAPVKTPQADPSAPYWDLARSRDTVDAYQLYLDRYPDGPNADAARARIADLKTQPERQAKAAEEALNLTRDQRREVQQNLTILNFDPKGVDGIFGPGSRGAIKRWQEANNFDATGYLTRPEMTALSAQGEKRAAELEAKAKERQAEIDRQDRAYWEQTGKAGDEAGLRTYLKKYPDGLFADLAQERLDKIEADRRAEAQAADRADWDAASKADTIASYRDYLASRDKPAFKAEAEARIAELQQQSADSDQAAAAKAREDALGLPGVAKTLVERRLAEMGLDPGRVDGVFDENTRKAIRRYQKAGGLTVTGYLDQATVAQLLAGAIGFR
ncbi:peptidoglycan-binding protein [Thioclava atlantica]|uniref:peptidoglycan-binding domain-containing protein n=1 Tax=Thioclava atlantica TaxID=1317124 RepID=UPI00056F3041|nr:peptidoglycan-binding protein [Thioclava atlantica]